LAAGAQPAVLAFPPSALWERRGFGHARDEAPILAASIESLVE